MRVFGFEPSKAALTPNTPASLSSSGTEAGAADVTIISISTAFARKQPQAKLGQPVLYLRHLVRRQIVVETFGDLGTDFLEARSLQDPRAKPIGFFRSLRERDRPKRAD